MRLSVAGLVLRPEEKVELLPGRAAERLGVAPDQVISWRLLRRSLDARGRGEPRFVCTLGLEVAGLSAVPDLPGVDAWRVLRHALRRPGSAPARRPVVVGAGPGGLFAALRLCEYGLAPVLLERGQAVDARGRAVAAYWRRGELDPENNVQFGEGGAGTFSDGKLTYRGRDPRRAWVFDRLVEAGAGPEILFDARPHLGTGRLRAVVKGLRTMLLAGGAEIRFGTRVERLLVREARAVGVECSGGVVDGAPVFLATGHSARDLYRALHAQGVLLEAKAFAAGVRAEVRQEALDRGQFGRWAGSPGLPAAEFSVKTRSAQGRDVYSFCMCPGGTVVPAGSEAEGLAVNGMSGSGRRGPWGNAALVVPVRPSDWPGEGPLAGLAFQREVEERAARLAGPSRVPAQRAEDFLAGRRSAGLPRSSCPWLPGSAALTDCLPEFLAAALKEALPALVRQVGALHGALLIAPETRTSSPVRITRGDDLESVGLRDLYPVGEGAGYAGGIVSAAIDGARAADAYAARLGGGLEGAEEAP